MTRPNSLRSTLAPYAASMRDADPESLRHFAADMMNKTGMIVLDPAWIRSPLDRDLVVVTAKTTFQGWGKNRNGKV
jgi:hypothetical protein